MAVLADVIFLEKLPALNSEDKPAGIARDTNISAQELQELEQQESGSQEGED